MSLTVRYDQVENTTGAALTAAGIAPSDGNETQCRIVQRVLAAADIGVGAGQTRDVNGVGVLIEVVRNTCFKEFIGSTYRAGRLLDSFSDGDATHIANIQYKANQEGNTTQITALDNGNNAGVQLAAGDVIIGKVFIGT